MNKLKEILIPVAVVAVGVLGAFATQMSGNNNDAMLVLEPAWIDNDVPCQTDPYMCSTIDGEICTVLVGGTEHELRGKENPNDATCPKPLFKP